MTGFGQYMQMARKAPNPEVAMSILDHHFGAMDAVNRLRKAVPKPVLPAVAGKVAAWLLYAVNPKRAEDLGTSTGQLPGTEYGPATLERRPDDASRVTNQVGMLFDKLPQYDADSHFPVPGTVVQGGL